MQGTNSSKKKKAAKVKRAMQAVKKAERRQAGSVSESFAAMQLLHDPQVCGAKSLDCSVLSDDSYACEPAHMSQPPLSERWLSQRAGML